MGKVVYNKLIISGLNCRDYRYERGIYVGSRKPRLFPRVSDTLKIVADSCSRTRKTINLLLESNPDMDKFITLTFAQHITDPKESYQYLKTFIKRLSYYLSTNKNFTNLKYLVVQEFTKKGRCHYHIVSNTPYLDNNNELEKIWQNGFTKINKIDNPDKVRAYLMKYITKDLKADKQYHRYYYSKNLNRPLVFYGFDATCLLQWLSDCLALIEKKKFSTSQVGQMVLKYYKVITNQIQEYIDELKQVLAPPSLTCMLSNLNLPIQLKLF